MHNSLLRTTFETGMRSDSRAGGGMMTCMEGHGKHVSYTCFRHGYIEVISLESFHEDVERMKGGKCTAWNMKQRYHIIRTQTQVYRVIYAIISKKSHHIYIDVFHTNQIMYKNSNDYVTSLLLGHSTNDPYTEKHGQ